MKNCLLFLLLSGCLSLPVSGLMFFPLICTSASSSGNVSGNLSWGSITGNIWDQSDLITQLGWKLNQTTVTEPAWTGNSSVINNSFVLKSGDNMSGLLNITASVEDMSSGVFAVRDYFHYPVLKVVSSLITGEGIANFVDRVGIDTDNPTASLSVKAFNRSKVIMNLLDNDSSTALDFYLTNTGDMEEWLYDSRGTTTTLIGADNDSYFTGNLALNGNTTIKQFVNPSNKTQTITANNTCAMIIGFGKTGKNLSACDWGFSESDPLFQSFLDNSSFSGGSSVTGYVPANWNTSYSFTTNNSFAPINEPAWTGNSSVINASFLPLSGGTINGSLRVSNFVTLDNGFNLTTGTNRRFGTQNYGAAAVNVSTNQITANSVVFMSSQNLSGNNPTVCEVSARYAGVAFTMKCTAAFAKIGWMIVEPSS